MGDTGWGPSQNVFSIKSAENCTQQVSNPGVPGGKQVCETPCTTIMQNRQQGTENPQEYRIACCMSSR